MFLFGADDSRALTHLSIFNEMSLSTHKKKAEMQRMCVTKRKEKQTATRQRQVWNLT